MQAGEGRRTIQYLHLPRRIPSTATPIAVAYRQDNSTKSQEDKLHFLEAYNLRKTTERRIASEAQPLQQHCTLKVL